MSDQGSWRQSNNVDALTDEYVTKSVRVFRVAVDDVAQPKTDQFGDIEHGLRQVHVFADVAGTGCLAQMGHHRLGGRQVAG